MRSGAANLDARIRRTGLTLAACLAGAGLAVAGCGVIPPSVANFANAPAVVRERLPLPACGTETVRTDADANIDGRRCLWSAYQEHRAAEFVTTLWSIEGDPITMIYRVLPGGAVEVIIDSTQDKWSAGTWLRLACPDLVLDESSTRQPAFGPGNCTETTIG